MTKEILDAIVGIAVLAIFSAVMDGILCSDLDEFLDILERAMKGGDTSERQ